MAIQKSIDEIVFADLQDLVDNKIHEDKSIEYKSQFPGNAKSEKVPLLATISSFANTSGGDVLLGIETSEGIPTKISGLPISNVDEEKRRLESMIATGLEPRLPRVDIRPIQVGEHRYVLLIRSPKSWIAPHRVKENEKFYGRNSAGKYPLDVSELRIAFTLSATVIERIRQFRVERIAKIYGRETPVPLRKSAARVMHLLPLSAFSEQKSIDPSVFESNVDAMLWPLGGSSGGLDWRINLDGFVTLRAMADQDTGAYTQLFRTGAVEAVAAYGPLTNKLINMSMFESQMIGFLRQFQKLAPRLDIGPPVYVFLSLIGTLGYELVVPASPLGTPWLERPPPLAEDVIPLPEIVVEDFNVAPEEVLRPAFDMIWNAFGLPRSLCYDSQGKWQG